MKPVYFLFLILFTCTQVFAQYNDPIYPKPSSGYGADGSHTVGMVSFVNPNYPAKNIEIYYPADISTKVPTIFYSHAYGGNISANISGVLNFVAMKGYAIVFVPYQTVGVTVNDRYTNLLEGFRQAARSYPNIIDTTKVGFVGHSFGGGASFGNAYKCFTENNWGQSGRFIYALAQWYTYNITQAQLQAFPANTKLLTEIFDDDVTNDHRMAIDIFSNISIPASEKDFILLKSDTVSGNIYVADHVVPNTAAAFNAFDYYAYYRLLDALCDYTFNGNLAGKDVALGNGSVAQVTMPAGLKNLIETDNPFAVYPESKYEFPCGDTQNERSAYCPVALGIKQSVYKGSELHVFPNPASDSITLSFSAVSDKTELMIYNQFGEVVFSESLDGQMSLNINISGFAKGLYIASCNGWKSKFIVE